VVYNHWLGIGIGIGCVLCVARSCAPGYVESPLIEIYLFFVLNLPQGDVHCTYIREQTDHHHEIFDYAGRQGRYNKIRLQNAFLQWNEFNEIQSKLNQSV
jgi:hypothetical protein